jgi:hypothetical protein
MFVPRLAETAAANPATAIAATPTPVVPETKVGPAPAPEYAARPRTPVRLRLTALFQETRSSSGFPRLESSLPLLVLRPGWGRRRRTTLTQDYPCELLELSR